MIGRSLSLIPGLVPLALLAALPAAAQADGAVIPEPSGLALLGLGVAGIILGRTLAARRPRD